MVFDVKDQSTLVLCSDIGDAVADKMVGSTDGEGSEQHEKGEQGQCKPLVFGFLLKQSAPPSSHASCCGVRPMKTLPPSSAKWWPVEGCRRGRRYHKGSIGRRNAWRHTYGT